MIQSLWQIDLINSAGTTRLLDYGDYISEEIRFSVQQDADKYSPIAARWGETNARLTGFVSFGWERLQTASSHAAARNSCLRTAADTATRATGTIRIAVQSGETWDISDATLISSSPVPTTGASYRTLTAYQVIGGRMKPYASITLYAGIPWDWTLQNWNAVTNQWQTL